MADTLEIFGVEYTNVAGIIATDNNETDLTYIRPQGTKSITTNGTGIDVAEYASVNVNVSGEAPTIQSLSVTPSETAQTFNASGVDGYKPVSVSAVSSTYVGSGIDRRGGSDITTSIYNNEYFDIHYVKGYYDNNGSKSVRLLSLPNPSISIDSNGLITSSLTITSEGVGPYKAQTVTATEQLTLRNSSDLTVSGATVTAPAGYYAEAASKSVSSMTLPTSAASSATSGYTSKATIGRSTAAQYINIPPGYNSAGAYYVISAVANGSTTGPSSLSGSSATITTGTNTITLTKTGVTTTPTVTAGYVSSATASTATVTLTASVTTKAAATITPTTTNQTIAAGTYLTGAQTIAGDADLVGGNILSTANIFGVQGTVVVQNYYTGSSAPSSSLGSNGDLYLQS